MKKLLSSLVLVVFLVSSMNVCEVFGLKAELPPGVREEVITIHQGWNLIAIPGLPHFGPYTVRQFIKDVERVWDGRLELTVVDEADVSLDSELIPVEPVEPLRPVEPIYPRNEWKVTAVAVYKDGQFKKLPPEGYSYNMVPGEAYFVYARYNGPWPGAPVAIDEDGNIIGGVWTPKKKIKIPVRKLKDISYHLNRGWNGISRPEKPPIVDGDVTGIELYAIHNLSNDLIEQGVKATRLAMWSAENQNWEQYPLPYEPVPGPDGVTEIKILKGNEGFFLLCDENNIFFRDGLEEVQDPPEPPFPPFPPKYIEYRGAVNRAEPGNPYEYVILVPAGPMLPAYNVIPLIYKDENIHKLLRKAEDVKICIIRGEAIKIEVNGYPMDAVVVKEVDFPITQIKR